MKTLVHSGTTLYFFPKVKCSMEESRVTQIGTQMSRAVDGETQEALEEHVATVPFVQDLPAPAASSSLAIADSNDQEEVNPTDIAPLRSELAKQLKHMTALHERVKKTPPPPHPRSASKPGSSFWRPSTSWRK